MKLSTRTRYGMRALLDMALQGGGQPIQLKDIAQRQQISLSYLEHLIIPLISAGFVKSTRGAKGGVNLARPADEIHLDEVMEILEGPLAPVDCLRSADGCARTGKCATQDVWSDLKNAMDKVLKSYTLQQLAERQKTKSSSGSSMYYI
jgi:Rrf2 family transcriptional regulator, cysteine metabolism repressor